MSTNDPHHASTDWGWVGPWILAMLAVGAFATTSRSPFIIVVFAITLICGVVACIDSEREKH